MAAIYAAFFIKGGHIVQFTKSNRTRINHEIRVPEVRLIDYEGTQLGVVKIDEAFFKGVW